MVLELTPNNRECLDFQDCPAVICFEHFSAQAGTKAGLEAATLSFDIRLDPVVWLFLSTPGGPSNPKHCLQSSTRRASLWISFGICSNLDTP